MKILLVSWHFPPSAEIAGKVTFRLARQLAAGGHEVTVLAPTPESTRDLDPGYFDLERSGVRIARVKPWPDMIAEVANFRRRLRPSRKPQTTIGEPTAAAPYMLPTKGLRAFILEARMLPDSANRWIVPVTRAARRLIARDRHDVLITVSPSFSAHLAGRRIRRKTPGIRWWAWSHDPASGNPFESDTWRQGWLKKWEAAVACEADGMLVTTDEVADEFARRYGSRPTVVACGFDPAELPAPIAPPEGGPLILTHTGALYGQRTPLPLLEAIGELRRRMPLSADMMQVRLIGDSVGILGEQPDAAIARLSIGDIVALVPPVSQGAALRAVQESHVGLILAERQPLQVPAKTFDYVGLGRPVLALTDGATAALVTRYHLGLVADRTTLPDVLADLLAQYRADGLRAMTARAAASAPALTIARQADALVKAVSSQAPAA